MRVSRGQLVIAQRDLAAAIAEFLPRETAALLAPEIVHGAILVKVGPRPRFIDLRPAIELRVAACAPTRLSLSVRIKGLPLINRLIRDRALPQALAELAKAGLSYGDGRIELDLEQLLPLLPVRFSLEGVTLTRGSVVISLRDLTYVPPGRSEAGGEGSSANGEADRPTSETAAAPASASAPARGADNAPASVPAVPRALASVPADEARPLYERLRADAKRSLERIMPGPLSRLAPWVLALPDLTVLLWRLTKHAGIDGRRKALAAAALAYIIWPLDSLPDFLPALGWLDDTTIALLALTSIASAASPELRAELWPGDQDVLVPLQAALNAFERVIGQRLFAALQRKLGLG